MQDSKIDSNITESKLQDSKNSNLDSKKLENLKQINSVDSINQYFIESKNLPVLSLSYEDSKKDSTTAQNIESKIPKEVLEILQKPIDSIKNELLATNNCEFLPKLYAIYKSVKEIDFNKLPNSFVLKTNHDSGGVVIIQDKEAFLKNPFIVEKMLEKLTQHLNTNYYDISREYHYKDIESRIFAEEMLGDSIPDDYKIHTFEHTQYMQVDFDRFTNHTRALFTRDFELLEAKYCYEHPQNSQYLTQKPKNLESMFKIARILGNCCNYVRVDLYNINGKIIVGELTFTPEGGTGKFTPNTYDKTLGDLWKI